ncbi:MAG: hypothetical protein GXP19_02705 [Gammaproteobacteria bacterium]|nr:hypothetical protein [Gammaproteobacteria bacterium]
MRLFWFLFMLFLTGCSNDVSETEEYPQKSQVCEFGYQTKTSCAYGDFTVEMHAAQIGSGELLMESLEVSYRETRHTLKIMPDTTFIEGDKGYISFEDINFDGIPDIAVTTSFGLANLYLNYWVFNSQKGKYIRLGNYCKLSINTSNKTLGNEIKINAANYDKNEYYWQGYELIKKDSKQEKISNDSPEK